MRWHNNEIGRNCLRESTDLIEGRCAVQNMAGCGDAAFTCHRLKLLEDASFNVLLICHEGKRDHRRSWCHKVRCVIKLTDVGELYRNTKTRREPLGRVDGLDRHLREIDRHEDISDAQFY